MQGVRWTINAFWYWPQTACHGRILPKNEAELKFKLSRAVTSAAPKSSLDLHSLRKDPKLQKNLSDYLDTALSGVNCNDMGELDEIIDTGREGLEELSCSKIEHVKKKEPWEDEQLQISWKDWKQQKILQKLGKDRTKLKN